MKGRVTPPPSPYKVALRVVDRSPEAAGGDIKRLREAMMEKAKRD